MLPITLGEASFKLGPFDIPYSQVSGAGVGVRQRRYTVHRSLMIGYRLPGDEKHRKIVFGLGQENGQVVEAFRARVADRWKGEAPFFEMNTRLGFSNKRVFGIVAAIVAVTVIAVVAWAATLKSPNEAPRRPQTSSPAPRR